MRISQHPNQKIALMDKEQQQELLGRDVPGIQQPMGGFTGGSQVFNNPETTHDSHATEVTTNTFGPPVTASCLQESIEVGMTVSQCSFLSFIAQEALIASEALLKDKIKEANYIQYFNYELTPDTWNLLVNK